MKLLPLTLALAALSCPLPAQDAEAPASAVEAATDADTATSAWSFDPAHSVIGFRVDHMGLADVIGRFHDFTGTILANTDDPSASTVEFRARIASIDTGVPDRDAHLQTAEFFDAENHPELSFESSEVEAIDGGYLVTGELSIKGETEEVEIPLAVTGPIEGMQGEQRLGARGTLTIDRTDFGLDYGTELIGTAVVIDLQIEAVQQVDEPAPESGDVEG